MNNALKWLINGVVGYAVEGNPIIVKTPSIALSVRPVESLVSWIVIYKNKKLHLVSETSETVYAFQAITSFIVDTDKEDNDADNS
jgi:hypothetical protein